MSETRSAPAPISPVGLPAHQAACPAFREMDTDCRASDTRVCRLGALWRRAGEIAAAALGEAATDGWGL